MNPRPNGLRRPPTRSRGKDRLLQEDGQSVWGVRSKSFLFRLSSGHQFIATPRAIILNIPILIPIIAPLFAWEATIWLMLIGLSFGMRYRIDSDDGTCPAKHNNLYESRRRCRERHQAKFGTTTM